MAGEVGLLSVGLGKQFNRYTIGGMYGFVPPEFAGGEAIETVTLRQTWLLNEWKRFAPYVGLNVYHALGLQYESSKFRDTPSGYYPVSSVRALFNLGLNVRPGKSFRQSFYVEGGINDLWLVNWYNNPRTVDLYDHVSLAIGLKHDF